jgi:hypothetical protein
MNVKALSMLRLAAPLAAAARWIVRCARRRAWFFAGLILSVPVNTPSTWAYATEGAALGCGSALVGPGVGAGLAIGLGATFGYAPPHAVRKHAFARLVREASEMTQWTSSSDSSRPW